MQYIQGKLLFMWKQIDEKGLSMLSGDHIKSLWCSGQSQVAFFNFEQTVLLLPWCVVLEDFADVISEQCSRQDHFVLCVSPMVHIRHTIFMLTYKFVAVSLPTYMQNAANVSAWFVKILDTAVRPVVASSEPEGRVCYAWWCTYQHTHATTHIQTLQHVVCFTSRSNIWMGVLPQLHSGCDCVCMRHRSPQLWWDLNLF